MNKLILLAVSLVLTIGTFGCKHTPTHPQAVAYLTLADIHNAVDKAMTVYGELCARDAVSIADQDRIDAAHRKYQSAAVAAIRAARFDWSTAAPDNVKDLMEDVLGLIYQIP